MLNPLALSIEPAWKFDIHELAAFWTSRLPWTRAWATQELRGSKLQTLFPQTFRTFVKLLLQIGGAGRRPWNISIKPVKCLEK